MARDAGYLELVATKPPGSSRVSVYRRRGTMTWASVDTAATALLAGSLIGLLLLGIERVRERWLHRRLVRRSVRSGSRTSPRWTVRRAA